MGSGLLFQQDLKNIQHIQVRIKNGTASPCWAEHSVKTVSFKVVSCFLLYMNSWYRSSLSRGKIFNSTSGEMEVGNGLLQILSDRYFGFVFETQQNYLLISHKDNEICFKFIEIQISRNIYWEWIILNMQIGLICPEEEFLFALPWSWLRLCQYKKRQLGCPTYAQAAHYVSKRGNIRKDTKFWPKNI